jgi:hypothetical protein
MISTPSQFQKENNHLNFWCHNFPAAINMLFNWLEFCFLLCFHLHNLNAALLLVSNMEEEHKQQGKKLRGKQTDL